MSWHLPWTFHSVCTPGKITNPLCWQVAIIYWEDLTDGQGKSHLLKTVMVSWHFNSLVTVSTFHLVFFKCDYSIEHPLAIYLVQDSQITSWQFLLPELVYLRCSREVFCVFMQAFCTEKFLHSSPSCYMQVEIFLFLFSFQTSSDPFRLRF